MPATDSFFRKLSTMHVVFAVSSLVLLIATIWMLVADHIDEWRNYQSVFYKIEGIRIRQSQVDKQIELSGSPQEFQQEVKQQS